MKDIIKAKKLLINKKYTCVLCKNEQIFTSDLRGVKPLIRWYTDRMDFKDFSAADKVVGKGAAYLYVLLGVKEIYAGVISYPALDVLKRANIDVEYGILVEKIINRAGDGICPFEEAVLEIDDVKEAYETICNKMKELEIEI